MPIATDVGATPRLPVRLLRRPRLEAELDRWLPLTVVRGIAGTGKTTLIASWVEANQEPRNGMVWLRPGEISGSDVDMVGVIDRHVAAVRAEGGERVLLILDDFQRVHDRDALEAMLDRLERDARLHICMCTRGWHPIELLVQGRVDSQAVNGCDLALTLDEVVALSEAMGRTLPVGLADELHHALGGWMTPTQLVIDAYHGGTLPLEAAEGFIERATVRALEKDPMFEAFMQFTLADPIETQMFTDLASVERPDRYLRELEWSGLGVLVADQPGAKFSIAPITRRIAQDVYRRHDPEGALRFHRALADWFLSRPGPGHELAAMQHAVWGKAWELAEEVWYYHGTTLMMEPPEVLRDLMYELSPEVLEKFPGLRGYLLCNPVAHADGPSDGYMGRLRSYFESGLATIHHADPSVIELVYGGTGRVVGFRLTGQLEESEQHANELAGKIDRALLGLGTNRPDGLPWFYLQWGLTRTLRADHARAVGLYRRAWEERKGTSADWVASNAAANLALTYAVDGRTGLAERWLDCHREFDTSELWGDYLVGIGAHVAVGLLALDRLDEEGVSAELNHLGDGSVPVELWPFVAYLHQRRALYFGRPELALINLRAVEESHQPEVRDVGAAFSLLLRSRVDLLLAVGDVAAAQSALETHASGSDPLLAVARCRVELLDGHAADAIDAASRCLDDPGLAPRERLELLLVQAGAANELGQKRQLAALAADAAEAFTACRSLAALLTVDDQVRREVLRLAPWPLTEAEIDDLRGRAQLYRSAPPTVRLSRGEQTALLSFERTESRKESAQELFRSLNTVKTQLNSAYRKLGTSSLNEALAKARALGLLPESTD
jgi:LuxR family maltose regulon positive regulatory protein